jgi:hypothetical protein
MTVNKHTSKVVQDGVELTWHQEGDSVKALQKFKDEDPRTQPELRKQDKARKEGKRKREELISWTFVVLCVGFFAYHCGQSHRGASRWGTNYHQR